MNAMDIVELVTPAELEAAMRDHLARRRLPDEFLYLGPEGAGQWLDLDESAAFGVASDLTDLLRASVADIAAEVPEDVTVVGLGVGGGRKERILLEALPPRPGRRYLAVDVSRPLVETALDAVADLPVDACGATARIDDLDRLRPHAEPPLLLCLLGNTFSNAEPHHLLEAVRRWLAHGDHFLFDCHLGPDPRHDDPAWRREVEAAYGSAENARFNLGPLTARGVPEDACRFSLRLGRVPSRLGPTWRTTKTIRMLRDVEVPFEGGPVRLNEGDAIGMGFTYKHTRRQVIRWLTEAGFGVRALFADRGRTNLLVLAQKGARSHR